MSGEEFVRLTVRSKRGTLDVVAPTAATPAGLVPQYLSELGEKDPDAAQPLALFTPTGRMLAPDRPIADARLVDGALLTLLPVVDAPSEPIVHDLIDQIVDGNVRGLWTARSGAWTLAFLAAVLLFGAYWLVRDVLPNVWLAPALLLAAAVGLRALGAWAASWTVWGVGGVVGLFDIATRLEPGGQQVAWLAGLTAALIAVTGALQWRLRAAVTAIGVVALISLVAWGSQQLGAAPPQTAGVVGVLALALLGLVPRIALAGSGMYALDEKLASGGKVPVRRAGAVIAQAYTTLTTTVLVLSVAIALCLVLLAGQAMVNAWHLGLLLCLLVALATRAIHLPLAVQRGAAWCSVVIGVVALAGAALKKEETLLALVVVLLVLAAVGLLVGPVLGRFTDVQAAHMRRIVAGLERVAMLASLPILVGSFGLYADLLETF